MSKKQQKFIETVWEFYERHGRRSLPWRKTRDPYKILVSEIMLQQTQVDRVLPKYESFLKRFPAVKKLAGASLGEVLREWQGLGYNRRAKMLHDAAKAIANEHNGHFPRTYTELLALPGIGRYTAGAIMAFAYNIPVPIIETNVRTVYLHHFFHDDTDVSDSDIEKNIIETLDLENPREWYYALMDYGSHIKKTVGNPNSRSKHYAKQSMFKGSDREIRGAIIRALGEHATTRALLHKTLPFEKVRIDAQLERLRGEGMIILEKRSYMLPK
jgi:A/G-specific adenine glycosylase